MRVAQCRKNARKSFWLKQGLEPVTAGFTVNRVKTVLTSTREQVKWYIHYEVCGLTKKKEKKLAIVRVALFSLEKRRLVKTSMIHARVTLDGFSSMTVIHDSFMNCHVEKFVQIWQNFQCVSVLMKRRFYCCLLWFIAINGISGCQSSRPDWLGGVRELGLGEGMATVRDSQTCTLTFKQ